MAMTPEQQRAVAMAEAKRKAGIAAMQKHPEFDPSNVPGYSRAGSAAMGAANAATLGFGDELASFLGSALTGVPRQQVLSEMRGDAQQAQEQNPGSYMAGQVGGGLAQAAATGGAGLGTMAARGGAGLGRVALGSALDGALYGGAYGAGSADDGGRLSGALQGAGIGAALGGGMPLAVAGATSGARRAATPFLSSPERQAAVDVLGREGVPLSAGQKTGNRALRYAESELGGNRASDLMDRQGEAFTEAAMRRAGGSGRATPDNLASLKGNLGQQFEAIAARNSVAADPQLGQDIGKTLNRYDKLLESQQKPIIANLADDIINRFKAGSGTMSGTDYQTIRSDLTRAAQSSSNQTLGAAMRGLRNALDDAMDRSINPQDAAAWKVLRKQYGNYKVVQKASNGAGEDAAMGLISPARLRMAASAGNQEGYATGASDFTDLAKAGQAVMTPLPNSGTASRINARNLGSGILAGGGALAGGLPGLLAGLVAPQMAGKALMSAPVQRYLSNQAVQSSGNPVRDAILAALLRGGSLPAIEGR